MELTSFNLSKIPLSDTYPCKVKPPVDFSKGEDVLGESWALKSIMQNCRWKYSKECLFLPSPKAVWKPYSSPPKGSWNHHQVDT